MFNLHVRLKTNRFCLENCTREVIPANPYFLPKSGEHYVTLTLFTADLSELSKIPFVTVCKIDAVRNMHSLVGISHFVF